MALLVTTQPSTLVRPANTTAYTQGSLIASSTTAGQVVLPSFQLSGIFGTQVAIPRIRLLTNATTGWGGTTLRVRFWTSQPVYAGGDGTGYSVTTGAARSSIYSGFDVTLAQLGDGAIGEAIPNVGAAVYLASGNLVFWDMQVASAASVTPISGQVFTLTPEVVA